MRSKLRARTRAAYVIVWRRDGPLRLLYEWYRKAAHAREPNSLARLAEKAGADVNGASLLQSFKYYAAAAHRAELEDWPLSEWKDWRYRQASLARLLARAGKTQEVARAYDEVRLQ